MSESAWQLLVIILAPVVFINLVLFGLRLKSGRRKEMERLDDLEFAFFIYVISQQIVVLVWLLVQIFRKD